MVRSSMTLRKVILGGIYPTEAGTLEVNDNILLEFSLSSPHYEGFRSIFWRVRNGHWRLRGEIILNEENSLKPYDRLLIEDYERSKSDWRASFHPSHPEYRFDPGPKPELR